MAFLNQKPSKAEIIPKIVVLKEATAEVEVIDE